MHSERFNEGVGACMQNSGQGKAVWGRKTQANNRSKHIHTQHIPEASGKAIPEVSVLGSSSVRELRLAHKMHGNSQLSGKEASQQHVQADPHTAQPTSIC